MDKRKSLLLMTFIQLHLTRWSSLGQICVHTTRKITEEQLRQGILLLDAFPLDADGPPLNEFVIASLRERPLSLDPRLQLLASVRTAVCKRMRALTRAQRSFSFCRVTWPAITWLRSVISTSSSTPPRCW